MCWDIGGPGPNTTLFASGKGKAKALGSFDDLLPADALLRSGHVVLFVAWNDRAKTEACVLEQTNTQSDMRFRVRKTSALKAEGYRGLRAEKLASDLGVSDRSPDKPDATTPKPDASAPPGEEEAEEQKQTSSEINTAEATSGEGDPGDVSDEDEDGEDGAKTKRAKPQAASGCNAAPTGGASSSLGGLLGLVVTAGLLRKRRRA
jgi:MYXO-CTERM domain-containing protein